MEVRYLPTCENGVPDGYGDYENCKKAAMAWVKFEDGSSLYVCEKHLEEIEEELDWAETMEEQSQLDHDSEFLNRLYKVRNDG